MNNENTISQIKSNHSKTTLFLGIFLVLLIIGGVIFIIFRVRRAPAGPPPGPNPAGPPPGPNPAGPPPGPKPPPVPTSLPPIIIGTGTNEVKIEDGKYYQFIGIPNPGNTHNAYLAHDDSGTNNGVHWCSGKGVGYNSTTGTCHGYLNATYNTIWQVKICPNNQNNLFSLKAIRAPAGTNMLQCEWGGDGCQLNAPDTTCQANTKANGTQLFMIAKSQASNATNLGCAITAVFTDDKSLQNQIGEYWSNQIKLFAEDTCQNCSFLVKQWTGDV